MQVHPSRLKYYSDDKLQVTEELREYISNQGQILDIKQILDHRWSKAKQDYELLIEWDGLEAIENSWETFTDIARDVHVLTQNYVATKDSKLQAHFARISCNDAV